MENKVLENLIKITSSERSSRKKEFLVEPVVLNFLQVKAVKAENLANFVEDLESLNKMLDNTIVDCYRLEIGP